MITIFVEEQNGSRTPIEVPTDMNLSLMEILKASEYSIPATCGGMALCASCQCYLISETNLPEQSDDELAMLDQAFNVKSNSRLGCQIKLTNEIDGLKVELAPEA